MATVTSVLTFIDAVDAYTYDLPAVAVQSGDLIALAIESSNMYPAYTSVDDSQGGNWYNARGAGNGPNPAVEIQLWLRTTAPTPGNLEISVSGHAFGSVSPLQNLVANVFRVAGMARYGSSAVRQSGEVHLNGPAGATPYVTLPAPALIANPVFAVAGVRSSAGNRIVPPPDFVEHFDSGTESCGMSTSTADGGIDLTTITWGDVCAVKWATIAVELDTTGGTPWTPPPDTVDPIWLNSFEIKVLTGR